MTTRRRSAGRAARPTGAGWPARRSSAIWPATGITSSALPSSSSPGVSPHLPVLRPRPSALALNRKGGCGGSVPLADHPVGALHPDGRLRQRARLGRRRVPHASDRDHRALLGQGHADAAGPRARPHRPGAALLHRRGVPQLVPSAGPFRLLVQGGDLRVRRDAPAAAGDLPAIHLHLRLAALHARLLRPRDLAARRVARLSGAVRRPGDGCVQGGGVGRGGAVGAAALGDRDDGARHAYHLRCAPRQPPSLSPASHRQSATQEHLSRGKEQQILQDRRFGAQGIWCSRGTSRSSRCA